MRSNWSFSDEENINITIECKYDGSLDNQVSLHSPIQCCSPDVNGELVIITNQPLNWSCSTGCGEHQVPYTMMGQCYQQHLVARSNNIVLIQDDCSFNANCVQCRKIFQPT